MKQILKYAYLSNFFEGLIMYEINMGQVEISSGIQRGGLPISKENSDDWVQQPLIEHALKRNCKFPISTGFSGCAITWR